MLTVLTWQLIPMPVIALAGAGAAGFFYVAWAVSGIFLIMMQNLALSLFAEGSNDFRGFRAQAGGALIVGVTLGTVFAAAVYLLAEPVLALFGQECVEEASSVLKVLASAAPLAAITYIHLGIERVRQRMTALMAVSVVVTLVMLGAILFMVPRLGIIGAGYGVVAGYGMGALLSVSLIYPMMVGNHQRMSAGSSEAA